MATVHGKLSMGYGYTVDMRDGNGFTALHTASQYGKN